MIEFKPCQEAILLAMSRDKLPLHSSAAVRKFGKQTMVNIATQERLLEIKEGEKFAILTPSGRTVFQCIERTIE